MNAEEKRLIGLAQDAEQDAVNARLAELVEAEKSYKNIPQQVGKNLTPEELDARVVELNGQLKNLMSVLGADNFNQAVKKAEGLAASNQLPPAQLSDEELNQYLERFLAAQPFAPKLAYISKTDGQVMFAEHSIKSAYGEGGYFTILNGTIQR